MNLENLGLCSENLDPSRIRQLDLHTSNQIAAGEVNFSNQIEVVIYIRILYLIVDISYGLFGFLMKNKTSK